MVETSPRWLVVLAPDGAVLAVAGGAPDAWVGLAFETAVGAHPEALAASQTARASLRDPARGSSAERVSVPPHDATPALELVAVEAIGLRRAPTDIAALLTSSLAALQRQADAIEVRLAVDTSRVTAGPVEVDPEKLAWAVTTLVGNAMRHVRRGTRSRPGGTIQVEARNDEPAGELAIAVSDDGPGIPEAQRPWLFRRKPGAPHAVGLGLMLVHDVVTAHGGVVELATTTEGPEHGTTITLRLPAR